MDDDEIPDDVRAEMAAQRRERIRMRHWCDLCHGRANCPDGPEQEDREEAAAQEGDDA